MAAGNASSQFNGAPGVPGASLRYHTAPIPMRCSSCSAAISPGQRFWSAWYRQDGALVSDGDQAACSPECALAADPPDDEFQFSELSFWEDEL